MTDAERLEEFGRFLRELVAVAAAETLPRFRAAGAVDNKSGACFDPVTDADREAEAAIRRALAARYPEHGVVGEEWGADRGDAEFVWVVDPVDGTRAFIAGLPLWTTLIGLRIAGEPVLGAIAQPYLGEVFWGGQGIGSRLVTRDAERPLRVRRCDALSEAVVSSTDPGLFTGGERRAWERVAASARLVRYGCDAYAYAMVAMGAIDLAVDSGLKVWDVDPVVPVVEGAGGRVVDWEGRRAGREGGRIVVAGEGAALGEVLAVLGDAR